MNNEELHILQHSLGLDRYSNGRKYRNHFVAGPDDAVKCRNLVAMGYMTEHKRSELSGGDPVFTVTSSGIAAMYDATPKPPKLTRSQKRYRDYLDSDSGFSFGEWLKQRHPVNRMTITVEVEEGEE